MFTLHQLRIALGKDRNRVNLALIVDQQCQIKDIHDFSKYVLTEQQYTLLQSNLSQAGDKNFVANDKIYLIDPLGNLFMYYTNTTNPMNILKDLKKVLEVSQIG
jgi:cytochrome oxidase Cu insertion factor (SCO1/SenC/PrrC family)